MTEHEIVETLNWLRTWVTTRFPLHPSDVSVEAEIPPISDFPCSVFHLRLRRCGDRRRNLHLKVRKWWFQPPLTADRVCEILDRKSRRFRAKYGYGAPGRGEFVTPTTWAYLPLSPGSSGCESHVGYPDSPSGA